MDNRSKLAIKFDALQRLAMINTLSEHLPLYIVTEYPKSGGTWIAQMVADYLEIPFPRNQRPPLRSCLMHGHMQHNPRMKNVICVFRDGRDVMVSYYYHRLFPNEHNSPHLVKESRDSMPFSDYDNIRANLPRFIQRTFEEESQSSSPFKFTWSQFVDSWKNIQATKVKYRDMRQNPHSELSRIISSITGKTTDPEKIAATIEKFSFKNQSGRRPGSENSQSFLRKGIPGDWRNKFTKEAAILFNQIGGRQLIELGFETDESWVETVG